MTRAMVELAAEISVRVADGDPATVLAWDEMGWSDREPCERCQQVTATAVLVDGDQDIVEVATRTCLACARFL